MASMYNINRYYHTPAKKGMEVRVAKLGYSSQEFFIYGSILSTPRRGMYFNVVLQNGQKQTFHPYDLDYKVDGVWVNGSELKQKHDAAWDKFNEKLVPDNK